MKQDKLERMIKGFSEMADICTDLILESRSRKLKLYLCGLLSNLSVAIATLIAHKHLGKSKRQPKPE